VTHPFLFYGAHPAEWYGGGRLDYELELVTAPDAQQRIAIAAAVRDRIRGAAEIRLDTHDRWHWADRWAALVIRTNTSETDWAVFFDEVAGLFAAIHAVHPLELVVCRSVDSTEMGKEDPWTAWSLAQRPDIGPRPRWAGVSRTSHDRFAARGAELPVSSTHDAAFEAARRAAR
jgi:hypothetical protein